MRQSRWGSAETLCNGIKKRRRCGLFLPEAIKMDDLGGWPRHHHLCRLLAFHGYNRDGGGLAERTAVRADMIHRLPPGFSPPRIRMATAAVVRLPSDTERSGPPTISLPKKDSS